MDPQLAKIIQDKVEPYYPEAKFFDRFFLVDSKNEMTVTTCQERMDEISKLSDAQEWNFADLTLPQEIEGFMVRSTVGLIEMYKRKATGNVFIYKKKKSE